MQLANLSLILGTTYEPAQLIEAPIRCGGWGPRSSGRIHSREAEELHERGPVVERDHM
jgi:hypothetical protein